MMMSYQKLLVTGVVVFSLFMLNKILYSPIYRKLPVEILETVCYVNIILLSFASFYTLEARKDQTVVAYISGTIIVSLFLVVLIYHIFTEICSKTNFWNKLRQNSKRLNVNEDGVSLIDYQQAKDDLTYPPQPTVSWMDAPSQYGRSLSGARESESEINKETPLLDKQKGSDSDLT